MSPGRWLRIRAQSPTPEQTDVLIEGLIAHGAAAVEQQGDTVIVYLDNPADAEGEAARVERAMASFVGEAIAVSWDWLDDEDWAREWRRGLTARRVGDRFIVAPTWIEPEPRPGDHVITIDPKMAFGTGEHATTRGMLRLMEHSIRGGDRVLDVGSGSAILAIGAVLLGADHVDAVESDPDAIENAQENIDRNGTSAQIALACELVDPAYLDARPAHYDVIVANVLSGVLLPLLPHFHASLRAQGRLLLSGILREEADVMIAGAASAGFALVEEDREEEWWSALLTR